MEKQTELSIRLLGGFTLTENNQPLRAFPSRAADAILAYVACHETPVAREQLINLIGGNNDPKQAAANLRGALSKLRKAAEKFITITRKHVSLQHTRVTVDVLQFNRALKDIPLLTATQLEDGLSYYHGDFLAQFYLRSGHKFEEWMLIMREQLQQKAIAALSRLVQLRLAAGDYTQGLPYAVQWLQLDPYNEVAHRQMMWLLLRTGQRNAALRHYEKCRLILDAEIGVAPEKATTDIFYLIRTLTFPPTQKLPVDRSKLIGRKAEITQLATLVAAKKDRLITLLGPGGDGKTRLAIALGQHLTQQKVGLFLHGTFFVALTAISSAAEVAQTIADALELQLRGDNPAQQLGKTIADKELLLILDNFEQLVGTDTALTLINDLLAAAPKLTLLITSRERLDLPQETIFTVAGLTLPPVDDSRNPLEFDAVKLFMQRAQQIRHDYQPLSYAPILETCRLVGGSPLAIELAASWVRQLSTREIADNVAKSLDFLASRNRNMPLRHRSLQAVFDYSWQLLTPDERSLLARLAVFSAEFDLAAAHAVAGATLPTLLDLADKSLLINQAGRFRLHALVRNFSFKQLDKQAATQAEINLSTYYAAWIETQLEKETNSIDPRLVSAEINNIRSAWQFAISHALPEALHTMLAPLFAYFLQRGWFREGIERFTNALPIVSNPAPYLIRRARFNIFLGDFASSEQDIATVLTHPHAPQDAATAIGYRAIIHINQGKHELAQQLALECLQAAKKINDPQLTAFAHNLVGGLHKMRGEYAAAQSNFLEGLTIRRTIGDRTGEAMVLNNLGNLAQVQGQYQQASTFYEQGSQLFKALNQPERAAVTLSNAGRLAWLANTFEKAQAYLQEALTIRRKHGNQLGVASTSLNLCHVLLSLNKPSETAKIALEVKHTLEGYQSQPLLHELYIIVAGIAGALAQVTLQQQLLTHVLAQDELTAEIKQLATDRLAALPQPLATQAPLNNDASLDTLVQHLLTQTASEPAV